MSVDYEAAWTEHRRRRRRYWWAAALGAPGVICLVLLRDRPERAAASPSLSRFIVLTSVLLVVAAMLLNAIALVHISQFRCPRCGKQFGMLGGLGLRNNPFTNECLHCHIRVGEEPMAQ
jgi:hypothetical protein